MDTDQMSIPRSSELISPREWLEFCEVKKQKTTKASGDPYTVLRCDFSLESREWRIWGMDFHLNRMKQSLHTLHDGGRMSILPSQQVLDDSLVTTRRMIDGLLLEGEMATKSVSTVSAKRTIIVFMVTVLWELKRTIRNDLEIQVRGHAFSTLQAVTPGSHNQNDPVKVVLGYLPGSEAEQSLPNRHQHLPQAKLNSWCRERRPLETLFKRNDIGDVILTRGSAEAGVLELLEGLTSNLFVVCSDNVLRTTPSSFVLGGYVRQKILDCAAIHGYRVEEGSLFLRDSSTWKEVFLTSSIRLIIPVNEILVPISVSTDGVVETKSVWKARSDGRSREREDLATNKLYYHLQQNNSEQ